jgi:hypothetical protein
MEEKKVPPLAIDDVLSLIEERLDYANRAKIGQLDKQFRQQTRQNDCASMTDYDRLCYLLEEKDPSKCILQCKKSCPKWLYNLIDELTNRVYLDVVNNKRLDPPIPWWVHSVSSGRDTLYADHTQPRELQRFVRAACSNDSLLVQFYVQLLDPRLKVGTFDVVLRGSKGARMKGIATIKRDIDPLRPRDRRMFADVSVVIPLPVLT